MASEEAKCKARIILRFLDPMINEESWIEPNFIELIDKLFERDALKAALRELYEAVKIRENTRLAYNSKPSDVLETQLLEAGECIDKLIIPPKPCSTPSTTVPRNAPTKPVKQA